MAEPAILQSDPTPTGTTPVWQNFWVLAGGLAFLRILVLIFSPTNLGPDEAQYWYWSQDLAFGYFSKPPLIGWVIALTTGVFGNVEWAVRLSAPLLHLGTASFLYLIAKRLAGPRIAFWVGLGWLTIPGVILSSFLMTTDAPLLFFWAGSLFFLVKIIEDDEPEISSFVFLGTMIGFGLLSKYAMIYFPVGLALLMTVAPLRKKLLRPPLLITAIIAVTLIAPNIIWNGQNDFQTLSHTAANANWGAELLKPLSLLEFLAGQFVVFGVIPFAVLVFICVKRSGFFWQPYHTALLIMSLTPLVVVATQAFISRAHANWAASAYPAAMILITLFLFQMRAGWLVKGSIALHSVIFVIFSVGILSFDLIDKTGLTGTAKDLRGWREQTSEIVAQGKTYDAILIDDRYLMSEMMFYHRNAPVDIRAIDPNANTDNHFEAFRAFDPATHKRVLFVTTRNDDAHVNYRFSSITPVGEVTSDLGPGVKRRYGLYALSGYFGPMAEPDTQAVP